MSSGGSTITRNRRVSGTDGFPRGLRTDDSCEVDQVVGGEALVLRGVTVEVRVWQPHPGIFAENFQLSAAKFGVGRKRGEAGLLRAIAIRPE